MTIFRLPAPRRRSGARPALRLAVVLAAGSLLVACGGDGEPRAGSTPTSTTSPTSATPTSSTGSPRPSTPTETGRPSASVKPTGTSTAPGSAGTLDHTCARRGAEQGITITTKPGGPAGFNTLYSDGSSSVDGTSTYADGFGGGFADAQGRFRDTWTVPVNAPTGTAIVRVVTQDGSFDLPYTVVAASGTCPA